MATIEAEEEKGRRREEANGLRAGRWKGEEQV
jgi:hypothetical protein